MTKKIFSVNNLITAAVAVLLVVGGWFAVDYYRDSRQARVYEEMERKYIKAMTEDTYGGKTPQETLDMFVAALRAGDIDLASKYFMIDENLSREKWVDFLSGVQNKGLLAQMAEDITRLAQPTIGNNDDDFAFEILNEDGIVSVAIDMQLNKYSGIWKIESI